MTHTQRARRMTEQQRKRELGREWLFTIRKMQKMKQTPFTKGEIR